ncbi:DNA binding domain, excisionase family [Slackia heliotrinireducens]|uniref:DNA-binding protein, excisionase family n=1 Tax=Slackia heliotrinireducens (strain ATCC 29202 / DSM 20476 / NCTC 11029 / RHS 1) TaxID=471855 RepID=C7N838_SLAHD|nr:helix-turn-helix domain-containing protein [Slackia heliotrinireducens]ACV23073.1 DNA-binding protein, excisionase family [Slackia heliotrinireducens DSM 20476]VEH02039.1 DNA binding domain, excisionase family [Slackia heliotrinireducens]
MTREATTQPRSTKDYLTLREASELGYGEPKTLKARIKDGTLPATKMGGQKWRVRRADLEALACPDGYGERTGAMTREEAIRTRIERAARELAELAPEISDEQRAAIRATLL